MDDFFFPALVWLAPLCIGPNDSFKNDADNVEIIRWYSDAVMYIVYLIMTTNEYGN